VRFGSDDGRSGPATVGQTNMLRTILVEPPNEENFLVSEIVALPAGIELDNLARAAGDLLTRHESLRTTYVLGNRPTQVVAGSGSFDIQLYNDDGVSDGATAATIRRRLLSRPIDVLSVLPLRMAAVVRDGRPVTVVVAFSHVATDYHGLAVACRELVRLASEPESLTELPPPVQPLDIAVADAARPGRVWVAAARHWESLLSTAPLPVFALPEVPTGAQRCGDATMESEAVALATDHIARRLRATPSSVLPTATAAVAGALTNNSSCLITTMAANRVARNLRDHVGNLYQDAVLPVDVRTGTFDDYVRRSLGATLRAYSHGRFKARARA